MTEVIEVLIEAAAVVEVQVEPPLAPVEVNLGVAGDRGPPGPPGPPAEIPDPGDLTLIFDNQLF